MAKSDKEDKQVAAATKALHEQNKKDEDATKRLNVQAAERELKAKHDAEDAVLKSALDAEAAANKVLPDREKRYKAVVEAYAKYNPVKYALKKERGEFSKIPDDFK